MKSLYDRVLLLASHPRAELILFLTAFAESSVFPVPPDILLIPMVLANFDKAFRLALVCTVGSVLGGLFGYGIGYLFYETAGRAIIDFYGIGAYYDSFQKLYNEFHVYIVAMAGFSPIPYKIFTIASGAFEANIVGFTIASALSRGARFFLIAWLLWRGGPSFKGWIENNLYPITMVASLALILIVVFVKFVLRM